MLHDAFALVAFEPLPMANVAVHLEPFPMADAHPIGVKRRPGAPLFKLNRGARSELRM